MCNINVITGTRSEITSIGTAWNKLYILDSDFQSKLKLSVSYFLVPALDRVFIFGIAAKSLTF